MGAQNFKSSAKFFLFAIFIGSCTAVGTGDHVLVKSHADQADITKLGGAFSHLLIDLTTSTNRFVALTTGATVSSDAYVKYMTDRFGVSNFQAATLNAIVRDRNSTPTFSPIDLTPLLTSKIADLMLKTDLTTEKKIELEALLKARLLNQPDLARTTTLHHRVARGHPNEKVKVYYYYPRVNIEFSSSLLSAASVDRFSYLGMAVRIRGSQETNENGDRVRFINFSPKAPDVAEYTRGKHTQGVDITAKASGGGNLSFEDVDVIPDPNQEGKSTTKTIGQELNFSGDLEFTGSEQYVNELKDSIEARTAGIFQQGKMFLVELRSIKNRRIGGTYSFDLLLEIPSNLVRSRNKPKKLANVPIMNGIVDADIYLVGIIRHVHDRGLTGALNRVPEPENDDTFHQVVYQKIDNVRLWESINEPFLSIDPKWTDHVFTVNVITGQKEAYFVVKNASNNDILGSGKGAQSKIRIKPGAQTIRAYVEFLNITQPVDRFGVEDITSNTSPDFFINPNTSGKITIRSTYRSQ